MTQTRVERDLLGEKAVLADAYYGIHTVRAVENFPIDSKTISDIPDFIRGMVMVKKAAALANLEMGVLDPDIAEAIVGACDEILLDGR
ncbi:MAG: lyase family protein, partial [Dietzia cercidiphylli]